VSKIKGLLKSLRNHPSRRPAILVSNTALSDEKQIEALEWEANKKDEKFDDLADSFPKVEVDSAQLTEMWVDITQRHPLLGTPCFSCQFFVECREDGDVNPEKCEFIMRWFQDSRTNSSS
jgi:hypothetical protein